MKKAAALSLSFTVAVLAAALLFAAPLVVAQGSSAKAAHPVQVAITSKLDSKSVAVGTPVTAKLLESVAMGGTTIPKGAKLSGKVTAVTPGQSFSFAFDTLEAKGIAAEPVHADVVSLAPKPSLADAGATGKEVPMSGTAAQSAAHSGMGQIAGSSDLSDLPIGSTIKGVSLAASTDATTATVTYTKNVKLDGTRMEVGLWTAAK
ncbi:MAG: hypothetical protein ACYCSN_18410 [Acidobacteriaceae bacterium]